jgi:phosphocarrier protein HPr
VGERRVTVASPVGLHARPAALFVRAVGASGTPVTIRKSDGQPVDAGSILAVLTLNVAHGDEVVLAAPDGAESTLDSLVELLRHPD